MNKRQAKKASKKVTFPIVDEMNLLTLTSEEYQKAMEDFHCYVQKHCRYKHYRDRYKKGGKHFRYHFPNSSRIVTDPYGETIKAFEKAGYKIKICSTDDIKTHHETFNSDKEPSEGD